MRNENLLLNVTDESSSANTSSGVERVAIKTKGLSRFTGRMLGVKKIKYSASAPAARRMTRTIAAILRNFFTVYFRIIQTELFQLTLRTFWIACCAHIPSVQN